MIQDYNNLATSLGLLNTEKDAKAEVVAKKKEEDDNKWVFVFHFSIKYWLDKQKNNHLKYAW